MAQATMGTILEYQKTGGLWEEISDVQGIPDIGGAPQEIDVTNLTDTETSSIPGVKQIASLAITLYMNNRTEKDNYRICRRLELEGKVVPFRITFPDGTRVQFRAIPTTTISAVSVNASQMFTLNLFKRGDFNIANPDESYILLDTIPDMEMFVGDFDSVTVHTIPAEVTSLTATIGVGGTAFAVVSVNGKQLTIQALEEGTASCTVTATNGTATTTQTFDIVVKLAS